ncbi:Predicted membrane protein [Pantoea agglomerans]|uniref:Predicted membrane protein n=1 Tax=Enterobacter agglomerans TaxID=549 RepID=A0A379AJM1_ENTAG|nr:Predicted membrane protein [Pantoea agglomerans]
MGWLALLGALLCVSSQLLRTQHLLLWYPVAVNLAMLLVFWRLTLECDAAGGTHRPGCVSPCFPLRQCAIPAASPKSGACFFIGNGSMAIYTCLLGDLRLWTLWNGGISYLLIAVLMSAEWLVRQRVRRKSMRVADWLTGDDREVAWRGDQRLMLSTMHRQVVALSQRFSGTTGQATGRSALMTATVFVWRCWHAGMPVKRR